MGKKNDGIIEKGHMENGKRHGTWEIYIPEDNEMPAYWYKVDYDKDEEIQRYDYCYEDGIFKTKDFAGNIIEANYIGCK